MGGPTVPTRHKAGFLRNPTGGLTVPPARSKVAPHLQRRPFPPMDRQHRRDLKHDKFVDELGTLSSRARQNQRLLLVLTAVLVIGSALVYGFFFYRSNPEQKAQDVLALAIETVGSPLQTAGQQTPGAKFKTEGERTAAAEKQFKDVQEKYA